TFLKAQNVLHADFVKNPILIDGKIEDWQEDFHFFDGSSGFFYAVSNDSNNLYLAFRSMETSTQMRFVELGMLLEITIKAQKKHHLYLEIPFDMKDKKNVFFSSLENARVMPKLFSFNEQEKQYALYYKKKQKTVYKMDSGEIPIKVFWDNKKVMTIEIALPFKNIFQSSVFNLSEVKSCILKVMLNAFDRATRKTSNTNSGPTDYGDMDNISRSGGGKVFGNDRKQFREQYEQLANELNNNRKMYNNAIFSQNIQLATIHSK
ncbi:MAG: hypothetical protein ACRC0A_01555, partial [Chitinophagaceae bacterium]